MNIVIDTNVIMAMLIKPGKPIDIFFKEEIEVFAPELLSEELKNNKEVIIEKSRLAEEEIGEMLNLLKEKIIFVPEKRIIKFRKLSETICPDPKDRIYFALALYLKCPIWSNEKKLKEQSSIKVYATHDLMAMFDMIDDA